MRTLTGDLQRRAPLWSHDRHVPCNILYLCIQGNPLGSNRKAPRAAVGNKLYTAVYNICCAHSKSLLDTGSKVAHQRFFPWTSKYLKKNNHWSQMGLPLFSGLWCRLWSLYSTTTTTSLLAFPIYIWYCLNKNKVIHVHVISTITKQISGQLN